MTDRVPGAPGQYKAVITQDQLENLQSGSSFIITLTRDDQPITEGTPYSKAAVLPDELAAKLCPEVEDPTPKDAFAALADKHKCFGSLRDIGITEFPTTMSAVAAAMPKNSMIVIDTREITRIDNAESTHEPLEEISDWGIDINGTAYISKGYSTSRVAMMVLYGSSTSKWGRMLAGNWALDTNAVNWVDYGFESNASYPGCMARDIGGTVEWLNPPMAVGTEYRTQKRHNGKPVYTKVVSFGALPNAGGGTVNHGISNAEAIVSCKGTLSNGSSIPYTGSSFRIDCQATTSRITIQTTSDYSDYTAVITLEYTKTTD